MAKVEWVKAEDAYWDGLRPWWTPHYLTRPKDLLAHIVKYSEGYVIRDFNRWLTTPFDTLEAAKAAYEVLYG